MKQRRAEGSPALRRKKRAATVRARREMAKILEKLSDTHVENSRFLGLEKRSERRVGLDLKWGFERFVCDWSWTNNEPMIHKDQSC